MLVVHDVVDQPSDLAQIRRRRAEHLPHVRPQLADAEVRHVAQLGEHRCQRRAQIPVEYFGQLPRTALRRTRLAVVLEGHHRADDHIAFVDRRGRHINSHGRAVTAPQHLIQ